VSNQLHITVSAGVAPNKFLAKIASDWKKPNGLFVITPDQVEDFVSGLPVSKLHGSARSRGQAGQTRNCRLPAIARVGKVGAGARIRQFW
jgi:nucleotidyltransferase/DNA polymerase involved in DNA repair